MKTNNRNKNVVAVSNKIIDKCVEIEEFFKGSNVKVTVVVRPSDNPEEEIVVGNDDYQQSIKALERTIARQKSGEIYG